MNGTHPTDTESSSLTDAERVRIDRALRRLHESMRDFWSAWPIDRRSASQLSRELRIDRTTCQRLSVLARDQYSSQAMLDAMPGPKALRGVISACCNAESPPSHNVLAAFRAAVDSFDELLRECAGSLSQLKRRIGAAGVPPSPVVQSFEPGNLQPQEALFHAARELTGRQVRTTSSIGLYDAVDVGAEELRHVRISSYHGIAARPDAVPMVIEAFDGVSEHTDDRWQRTPALLQEYTSAQWSAVDLQQSRGFASRAIEIAKCDDPSDVCYYTAFPVPHPRVLDHPIEESWFILYAPAATLVFDLYLHESIARQCLVSLDIHLWQTSFANYPHGRWHTRMPQVPRLVQLGRGLQQCDSPFHPRHRELTQELFTRANVNPKDYIGFRCEERFPLWRLGYRYELDFGDSGDASGQR